MSHEMSKFSGNGVANIVGAWCRGACGVIYCMYIGTCNPYVVNKSLQYQVSS